MATYAFYREGLPTAAARLRAYVHGGDSGYLDEPATAAALAGVRAPRPRVRRRRRRAEIDELIGVAVADLARLAKRPIPA